jgi:hypothetical protein
MMGQDEIDLSSRISDQVSRVKDPFPPVWLRLSRSLEGGMRRVNLRLPSGCLVAVTVTPGKFVGEAQLGERSSSSLLPRLHCEA